MSVTKSLNRILDLLPIHAEEGRLREIVSESSLISQLGHPESPVVVALIQRILESFELLDRQELSRGNWAFVSFPASLLARSLISTWAEPQQSLVESGYWESDSDNPSIREEQRGLLHILESRRQRLHPTGMAQPIRFVHVAWGIIRLGGQFLLHRREDQHRPNVKQFVLPGGRLRPSDLPSRALQPSILRDLSAENSIIVDQSLPNTLIRELDEELGLHVDKDYKFQQWKRLQPYCAVEGNGNKHALTRYDLLLFHVKLTALGESRLLERIATDPTRYTWFSVDDMVNGCRPDGTTAYFDALYADMGDDLREQLDNVPDASGVSYQFVDEYTAVDLPAIPEQPFQCGKTGKERDYLVPLNDFGWELIVFLAWCARGFSLRSEYDRVLILGGGWVKLLKDDDVAAAKGLASALADVNLPLIQFNESGVRLAIKPDQIYFSDAFFSYAYHPSTVGGYGGQLELNIKSTKTRFASLEERTIRLSVPPLIASVVEAIEANRDPAAILKLREAGDLPRQNRETVTAKVRQLGLRRLIRMPGSEKDKDLRMLITIPRAK